MEPDQVMVPAPGPSAASHLRSPNSHSVETYIHPLESHLRLLAFVSAAKRSDTTEMSSRASQSYRLSDSLAGNVAKRLEDGAQYELRK